MSLWGRLAGAWIEDILKEEAAQGLITTIRHKLTTQTGQHGGLLEVRCGVY